MNRKLKHIIHNIPCKLSGSDDISIQKLEFDSRKVEKGDLFIALRGTQLDGHNYIGRAIDQGAVAVMCESVPEKIVAKGVSIIQVNNSASALGDLASNFYDNPVQSLKLVGVTGTNGKTSIVTLLYSLLTQMGVKCGLLSTVINRVGQKEVPATHTTPDTITIHRLLKEMLDEGCTHVFMEVSSHAIDQDRIAGLEFDLAIFTNLTHDHLDYHKTFDDYLKTKKRLFDGLAESSFALVNNDDRNGKVMVQNTSAKVKTFGVKSVTDFKAKIIESHFDGMLITLDNQELWIKLIGLFNASNMLAVYGAACLLGFPNEEILRIISTLNTVEGRFENIQSSNEITAIIDYAHTPDALKNVLTTIREIKNESSDLITVVGAGGDRDRSKRPLMGKLAAELSERVILTSDNPRSEDPDSIIKEMHDGIEKKDRNRILSICDRKEAIRTACMLAKSGDVVLIAGKGHETYQEIKGVRNYFNDKQIIADLFENNDFNL